MIVVDTNIIVYAVVRGSLDRLGADAAATFVRDPHWTAPLLWRSEFCNALALQVEHAGLPLGQAMDGLRDALALLAPRERQVDGEAVLHLATDSGCTAYDCEFVALAKSLAVPLVTTDKQILKAFPDVAVSLADFARS